MSDDDATIGFRVDEETKERFERTIARAHAEGVLDLDTKKSHLLRQCVHDIIDDLDYRIEEARDEGNPNLAAAD